MQTAEKQADILKDQGNLYFKKERLAAAIEAYTEAITLCPDVPTYWTNRALCHKKRNDWKKVEADCRKAIELDRSSLKARYMLGLALLQNHQYEEAIKQLEKALELGRAGASGDDMVEVIWSGIAKAKYAEWEQAALPRKEKQKQLRELCEKALSKSLNKALGKVVGQKTVYIDDSEISVEEINKSDAEVTKIINVYAEQKQTLVDVFERAAVVDNPCEIPEYLCCKITMDIFRDPVITPSGVTYERAVLLDHLEKVGKFDPLTRTPLQRDQLYPNLAIKEAAKAYLSEHGWAYKLN